MIKRRHLLLGALAAGTGIGAVSAARAESEQARSIPFRRRSSGIRQAPFGDQVSSAITRYNRVSPYLANAGLLTRGGLEEARELGFRLIVDLRQADEPGAVEEAQLARALGIEHRRVAVAAGAPKWQQVTELTALIHQPKHYPVLIHCVSSNRSGAIWAMYRARLGVPLEVAIEEGRAAGLESREDAVRARLRQG